MQGGAEMRESAQPVLGVALAGCSKDGQVAGAADAAMVVLAGAVKANLQPGVGVVVALQGHAAAGWGCGTVAHVAAQGAVVGRGHVAAAQAGLGSVEHVAH